MPPPGDSRAAQLTVEMHDFAWEGIYAPIARLVMFSTERLNALQFMTIRAYLSLVFFALIVLLIGVALWP